MLRTSLQPHLLCSSAIFARRSAAIESKAAQDIDQAMRFEHMGLVIAAILQSVAAVEAESAELLMHGPGHHLGSDGVDVKAHALLKPLAEVIERQPALDQYKLILRRLGKKPVGGGKVWNDMWLLIELRHAITHYKSLWDPQIDEKKLFKKPRSLNLKKPSFYHASSSFFPFKLLSAECAAWSVRTAVAFINAVYGRLGIVSPLKHYMDQFKGL